MTSGDETQARITAFWSMVAPNYEARPGNVPTPDSAEDQAWVEAMVRLLPIPPSDVLDLGTGTGYLARVAAGLGHRVVATDLSAAMLAEGRASAERQQLEIRFEQRDAVAPGYDFSSFDAITCRHLLWTLRSPLDAFRHWRALLRPGGRVVAIDAFVFTENDEVQAGPFEAAYGPETRAQLPVMTLDETTPILDLFREAGFADVTSEELIAVHAASDAPPSERPWYAVVAMRGDD
jgi:ubiquinone/menaquinone biosynthesis C-methylase UbiE